MSSEEYETAVADRDSAIARTEAKDRLHAEELYSLKARHAADISCKMNDIDFGHYIETVLTRIHDGDTDCLDMNPNVITLPKTCENTSAA